MYTQYLNTDEKGLYTKCIQKKSSQWIHQYRRTLFFEKALLPGIHREGVQLGHLCDEGDPLVVPVEHLEMVYQGWRLSWCIWPCVHVVAAMQRNSGVLTAGLVPGPAQQALPLPADALQLVHLPPIHIVCGVLTTVLSSAAGMVAMVEKETKVV